MKFKKIQVADHDSKLKILAQTSSGLRRGESLSLKKRDLDITQKNYCKYLANITKTKKSRVTFFSKEV